MLFASLDFLLFFLPVLAGYWALRDKPLYRELFVIAASYFFYMASSRPPDGSLPTPWYFAGLLIFSTLLDYFCSHAIAKEDARAEALKQAGLELEGGEQAASARRRNFFLILSLVGNLGLLGYFKYTNFLLQAGADIANALGIPAVAPHLELMLPIGISFYTFQSLSYSIDVWRKRLTPEPSFRRFALFVVFFPQLVAGPIVRASEFLPQLHKRPGLSRERVDWALYRIWKGLLKKVVLGDFIAANLSDIVFSAPQDYTSLENLIALYGFTLQIYADFSGYSDIAIGVAALLGFVIPENFDRPHQATHLGDFWRRWHMTLSTWLRDYLFFPLGGSRGSPLRVYFNLWLTMFLVGMWHAASWNFVIYSNLHGFAMVFNRWNRRRKAAGDGQRSSLRAWLEILGFAVFWGAISAWVGFSFLGLEAQAVRNLSLLFVGVYLLVTLLPDKESAWNRVLHIAITFHFTVLSRVFFRAEDTKSAALMVDKLVQWDGLGVRPGLFRFQGLASFAKSLAPTSSLASSLLTGLAEYLLLWVLVLGLGYQWTPKRWVDDNGLALFRRLPGPVIGLLFALTALLIMKLLDGPRANIYFVF